ncbi:MAG: beta-galactosidase [Pseudomonadota bacterium]
MTQPNIGVCYYPEHWPESQWPSDAKRMRALGITQVRIGEFAWANLEPTQGEYEWAWLDRAVECLAFAGLKIIMGTPTACPPRWLVDALPDMLPVDEHGRARGFGSRRHYSTSSVEFAAAALGITTQMAERYGQHPAIAGWQIDNEFGCHDTTLCYSPAALSAFHEWLAQRYGDIDSLNAAWGNVFWSQTYARFTDVGFPVAVTETNPAHRLAFHRFSSDQMCAFNDAQLGVIRSHIQDDVWVTHNFMGNFLDFDHFKLAQDLDVATWDSYPLGFLDQSWFDDDTKARYRRSGHPDWAAFHHDLYRAVGHGRFGVMEQQPGAVNWASSNAQPEDGMVRLWSWEAVAHGAELVSYFRWRQPPFAQEQMHAGLLRPDDQPANAHAEVAQFSKELARLRISTRARSKVALVFDYDAAWMMRIQPQQHSFDALAVAMAYYSAARASGVDVDIVSPDRALAGYAVILLPCIPHVSATLAGALEKSAAQIVLGPRAGSKNAELSIADGLPPGPLQALIDLKVTTMDAMRDGVRVGVDEQPRDWFALQWLEQVDTALPAQYRTHDGRNLVYQQANCRYINACVSEPMLASIIAAACADAGVVTETLPPGVRLTRRGRYRIALNYGSRDRELGKSHDYIIGGPLIGAHGVSIWQEAE